MSARLSISVLCSAAFLASAATGLAADIPGSTVTKAKLSPTGGPRQEQFDTATDRDWCRVKLIKGETYAVSLSVNGAVCAHVELRDAKGRLLKSAVEPDMYVGGFEYTVKKTGTYFVAARRCAPDRGAKVEPYVVRITIDCAGSKATTCALKVPGATGNRLVLFYPDFDWWKVSLKVGQSYSFKLDAVRLDLRLRDASGKYLATGKTISNFVPTKTGTYYLEVISDEDETGNYRIVASQP